MNIIKRSPNFIINKQALVGSITRRQRARNLRAWWDVSHLGHVSFYFYLVKIKSPEFPRIHGARREVSHLAPVY